MLASVAVYSSVLSKVLSLTNAKAKIEDRGVAAAYNESRPDTSLRWMKPQEFAFAAAQKATE